MLRQDAIGISDDVDSIVDRYATYFIVGRPDAGGELVRPLHDGHKNVFVWRKNLRC
ncbi:MAG: hypothetical protein R2856_34900 [Caldilineaceae bacterium]